MGDRPLAGKWALILGASSGFGEATALELAREGMNIVGVHLDRRATMPNVERIINEIEASGGKALFFNVNAADAEKRTEVITGAKAAMIEAGSEPQFHVLMHSLAFGTLRELATPEGDGMTQAQLEMTLNVMANSLVYWTQDLLKQGLLGFGSRLFGMTSEGGTRIWRTYGAVSAAKVALESYLRQLGWELAPLGITANAIRAGVTDTPALRKIPGHEGMLSESLRRNPTGRLTSPQDVASAIALLARPGAQFISGNVIGVDGGEATSG